VPHTAPGAPAQLWDLQYVMDLYGLGGDTKLVNLLQLVTEYAEQGRPLPRHSCSRLLLELLEALEHLHVSPGELLRC
jgi:hypothetical protein